MLRRLTIKRFKSIYDARLSFGRANLFIGVNGTGKSNILEALGLLASALSRGLDGDNLESRGVRFSLPHLFKSSFRNTDLSPTLRLEAQFEHGSYNCSIRAGSTRSSLEFHSEELFDGTSKIFGRGPNGIYINKQAVNVPSDDLKSVPSNRGFWDILYPFAEVSPDFRRELEDFGDFAIYAPQTAIMRGVATENRIKEPLGLAGGNLAPAFRDALHYRATLSDAAVKEFDDILSLIWAPGWANSITAGSFDANIIPSSVSSSGLSLYIKDKFMKTNRNMLSTFDASEGTLYLIFVASLLLHPGTPNIFALDNVDGTLNARLVRQLTDKLVEVCTSPKVSDNIRSHQSFVTSHHPASLDSFDIFSSEQRVFVARRRADGGVAGSTYFDRLTPGENLTKAEWIEQSGGKNLSELLLEGLIPGGL
ncbi:AAA family ATPase [Sphingomonas citri]